MDRETKKFSGGHGKRKIEGKAKCVWARERTRAEGRERVERGVLSSRCVFSSLLFLCPHTPPFKSMFFPHISGISLLGNRQDGVYLFLLITRATPIPMGPLPSSGAKVLQVWILTSFYLFLFFCYLSLASLAPCYVDGQKCMGYWKYCTGKYIANIFRWPDLVEGSFCLVGYHLRFRVLCNIILDYILF